MLTSRQRTTAIRKIVNATWKPYSVYNDKRADGRRRLKFMRNGYPVPLPEREAIADTICTELDKRVIEYDTVTWRRGWKPGYGEYDYVEIIVPEVK